MPGQGPSALYCHEPLQDGAKGLAEIKQAGGITMVQSPEDAEFAGMPESATAYDGIVDVIAGIDEQPAAPLMLFGSP
jgi:two-component system, chemotaxis family, CheB/CheR fusion protein